MRASKELLELAGELVQKLYPNIFAVYGLADSAVPVVEYLKQHAEIGADLSQNPKTMVVEIADIFNSTILLLIQRGVLRPLIELTPEALAELRKMDAKYTPRLQPAPAAPEVVAAPAPAKSKAELEAEADAAMVDAYRTNHRELRDAVKKDPKQRARMERLIAAGRI